MNKNVLISMACLVKGSTIVSLDTCTDVKLTGRDNPHQGTITKVTSKVRAILFENTEGYHNLVAKRLAQEGITDYVPGKRTWGEHVEDTPLIVHNGNLYLQAMAMGCGEIQYRCNNKPVSYQEGVMVDSDGFIISGIPSTPMPAEQGGLINKVITRTYKAESILEVRAFGKIWK